MSRKMVCLLILSLLTFFIQGSNAEEIWGEAEKASSITAPYQIIDDVTASGGQYIAVDGTNNTSAPSAEGTAEYTVDVEEGGVYRMYLRVLCTESGDNDDSCWVRVQGATLNIDVAADGWINDNNIDYEVDNSQNWFWKQVGHYASYPGNDFVEMTMDPGTYTVEIANREDGLLIDGFLITNEPFDYTNETHVDPALAGLVTKADAMAGYDFAMVDRLESLGYVVTIIDSGDVKDGTFSVEDAETFGVIVVSEVIGSSDVIPLAGAKVPMMNGEGYGWHKMNYAEDGTQGWQTVGTLTDLVNDTHPIVVNAGLSMGQIAYFLDDTTTSSTAQVSVLAPGAVSLLSKVIDGNDYALIFAIDEGAQLAKDPNLTAPARIVGFSLPGNQDPNLSDEGWALFDASIRWMDPAPVKIPDMVAHYPLDEGTGLAVADASGNGHDGVILGEPNNCWVEGIAGTALQFGVGVCDGVDCNMFNPSADTNELTVACWTKFALGGAQRWTGIVANRTGYGSETNHWAVECDGNSGSAYLSSRNGSAYGLASLPDGEWAHLAITTDGETTTSYLNGEQANSSTSFKFGDDKNSTVRIGASEASGNIFNGAVDDVRLFDVVLSAEEVAAVAALK